MALKTLMGVTKIGEFDVLAERPLKADGTVDWPMFDMFRESKPIFVDHAVNMVSFKIQDGPVKEKGINGCQVDTLIETAKIMVEGLNKTFPCRENALVITKLEEALHWLDHRKKNRVARGVEGESKP